MSQEQEDKLTLKDKLDEQYRVTIRHEKDLKEVRNFKFTLTRLYTIVLLFILLSFILITSLFFFTPLRKWVPGYAEITNNTIFIDLNEQILNLEKQVEQQETYVEGLINMISERGFEEKTSLIKQSQSSGKVQSEDTSLIAKVHKLDQKFFIPPIKGSISKHFKLQENHLGIDVLAPKNTPIKSILEGVVVNADWSLDAGNVISIQHEDNILSIYKHNSILLKQTGDFVKAGEAIAIIGNSGELTDGPHLHFELWYKGRALDPAEFINF